MALYPGDPAIWCPDHCMPASGKCRAKVEDVATSLFCFSACEPKVKRSCVTRPSDLDRARRVDGDLADDYIKRCARGVKDSFSDDCSSISYG